MIPLPTLRILLFSKLFHLTDCELLYVYDYKGLLLVFTLIILKIKGINIKVSLKWTRDIT